MARLVARFTSDPLDIAHHFHPTLIAHCFSLSRGTHINNFGLLACNSPRQFGGRLKGGRRVANGPASYMFPLTLDWATPEVAGVDAMLSTYQQSFTYMGLSGQ